MSRADKDIRVVRVPEREPDYPVWPGYTPLWPVSRIRAELEALIVYRGHEAKTVIDFGEVVKLVNHIVGEYNAELSLAQFRLWQVEGMLKEKSSGR